MQPITTPSLVLQPLTAAHADAMFDLLCDPEIYRYLDESPPTDVESLRAVYARREIGRSADGREIWLNWMIVPKGQPPVGYVQATLVEPATAWVAYVLASRFQGRGFAVDAVGAMLEHLAAVHRVDRFLATVEVANTRSVRLLERLGFSPVAATGAGVRGLAPTERLFVR